MFFSLQIEIKQFTPLLERFLPITIKCNTTAVGTISTNTHTHSEKKKNNHSPILREHIRQQWTSNHVTIFLSPIDALTLYIYANNSAFYPKYGEWLSVFIFAICGQNEGKKLTLKNEHQDRCMHRKTAHFLSTSATFFDIHMLMRASAIYWNIAAAAATEGI